MSETECGAQFFLWRALHSHEKAALLARAARPLLDEVVDRLPSTQVEISDAEVGTASDVQRGAERGEQFELDIVKDPRHRYPYRFLSACSATYFSVASRTTQA